MPSVAGNQPLPDESRDIEKDVADLVSEPDKWLDMPNDQLGGKKPQELIGTPQERQLRDLLRSIKYGMFT